MRKTKLYQPTPTELKDAPGKFLYELRTFRLALWLHFNLKHKNSEISFGLKDVTLESALLHARNLLDFFSGHPSKNDDIVARHFTSQPSLSRTSSKMPYLTEKRDDLNKSLSHLTYTRLKRKPRWHLLRIRKEIEDSYAEFLALLPKGHRNKWKA